MIFFILMLSLEDAEEAADCILHVWYSAQLTTKHMDLLNDTVQPLIRETCYLLKKMNCPKNLMTKKWKFGDRSIHITLAKQMWFKALECLALPQRVSHEEIMSRRTQAIQSETTDMLEKLLFLEDPGHRLSRVKFREDGILLPYSNSRKEHGTPNP
jgi:hypothetical protein